MQDVDINLLAPGDRTLEVQPLIMHLEKIL